MQGRCFTPRATTPAPKLLLKNLLLDHYFGMMAIDMPTNSGSGLESFMKLSKHTYQLARGGGWFYLK